MFPANIVWINKDEKSRWCCSWQQDAEDARNRRTGRLHPLPLPFLLPHLLPGPRCRKITVLTRGRGKFDHFLFPAPSGPLWNVGEQECAAPVSVRVAACRQTALLLVARRREDLDEMSNRGEEKQLVTGLVLMTNDGIYLLFKCKHMAASKRPFCRTTV